MASLLSAYQGLFQLQTSRSGINLRHLNRIGWSGALGPAFMNSGSGYGARGGWYNGYGDTGPAYSFSSQGITGSPTTDTRVQYLRFENRWNGCCIKRSVFR